jgi:DNA-binding NarL/FixJ family response regulator
MNIDDIAGRIPSLSAGLIKILASMSEGMSNGQIAERLGYKNASIVSTYISLINKQLCLTSVDSRIEKRQIAIDAFKRSRKSAGRHDSDIFPPNK